MLTQAIAILGTGAMGSRVASNLLDAGYSVIVWNRSSAAIKPLAIQGATVASTPRQATERASVVISMLTDNEASKAVWITPETGAIHGLRSDTIAIESSTLSVAWTQSLATKLSATGSLFLAAPVVGSRPQAEAGSLLYLVGGPPNALATVQSVLEVTGDVVLRVGSVGQAMALKLAVNSLFGIQVAALAESLVFLRDSGISLEKAMNFLNMTPVISPAAQVAGTLIVSSNHAPLFPIDLVEKDFFYTLQTAKSLSVAMPTAAAVHQAYKEAIAQNYGGNNITGIVDLFAHGSQSTVSDVVN